MSVFFAFAITGLITGAIYALIASGLVVTYNTTGIFNFAHGAVGMVGAFVFRQLWLGWGINPALSLAIVLLIVAPAFGLVVEVLLMRNLRGAPVDLTLVVTLGLLLFLVGAANIVFDPTTTSPNLTPFFNTKYISLSGINVSYDQVFAFGCLVVTAIGLYLLFSRTRLGIAMRAVVDSPDLVSMAGGRPIRIQQVAWMIGCSLAALAGILIAQLTQLNILNLTLLVVDGYAAAIIGRLRSLPIAIVGALLIGVGNSLLQGYVVSLTNVSTVAPIIILFLALLVLPQDRIKTSGGAGRVAPRVASLPSSIAGAIALIVVAVVAAHLFSAGNTRLVTEGMAVGIVLLSLVLLTGYGGMISLCQMTIAGIGAVVASHVDHGGSILSLIAAAGAGAVVGAVLALPTLRLRGLYLALGTFSFAAVMDGIGFSKIFGIGGSVLVHRPHILGIPTTSDSSYLIFVTAVFGLVAIGVLALRRSSFGRRLVAINDSPAACSTLGISVNRTKLITFTIAAAMAGLAGSLYAAAPGQSDALNWQALVSLTVLLLARVGGINTATGAAFGGFAFIAFLLIQPHLPVKYGELQYLLTGLAAISVGRDPNGFGGRISALSEFMPFRRPAPAPGPVIGTLAPAGTAGAAFLSSEEDLVHAGR